MDVLVIGGTGFIGSWIVKQLVARGDNVTVLHGGRKSPEELPQGAISIISEGSQASSHTYEAALGSGEPDAVIHVFALFERDAKEAVSALSGRAGRIVVLSSGDVYRAYGRFTRLEPGPPDPTPLKVDTSPLRRRLYPYRTASDIPGTLRHDYDKIPVENIFRAAQSLSSVILRLPKVYGSEGNADLATIYNFAAYPAWRWTHGYVENVAAAAVLAAHHPRSPGRTYNIGEAVTPTVGERLAQLPPRPEPPRKNTVYDFGQSMDYDTEPVRTELGFIEPVTYDEGLRRTLAGQQA
jgi:nucleoside-diphosphate-sugar epimerase